jgi:hypothetical protein
MSHDAVLRNKVGATQRTIVERVLRVYDEATPLEKEVGSTWYDVAGEIVAYLGQESGWGRLHTAAVVAHLSPRFPWPRNVAAAEYLLIRGMRLSGVIGRSYRRALHSLTLEDPGTSLTGPKTQRFYRNLLGDLECVTVDIWAARAVGVSEMQLARAGVYQGLEHAYRLAARRRGITPAAMQATTWVVARGGHRSGAHVPFSLVKS